MIKNYLSDCTNVPLVIKCGPLEEGRPLKSFMQVYPTLKTQLIYYLTMDFQCFGCATLNNADFSILNLWIQNILLVSFNMTITLKMGGDTYQGTRKNLLPGGTSI